MYSYFEGRYMLQIELLNGPEYVRCGSKLLGALQCIFIFRTHIFFYDLLYGLSVYPSLVELDGYLCLLEVPPDRRLVHVLGMRCVTLRSLCALALALRNLFGSVRFASTSTERVCARAELPERERVPVPGQRVRPELREPHEGSALVHTAQHGAERRDHAVRYRKLPRLVLHVPIPPLCSAPLLLVLIQYMQMSTLQMSMRMRMQERRLPVDLLPDRLDRLGGHHRHEVFADLVDARLVQPAVRRVHAQRHVPRCAACAFVLVCFFPLLFHCRQQY